MKFSVHLWHWSVSKSLVGCLFFFRCHASDNQGGYLLGASFSLWQFTVKLNYWGKASLAVLLVLFLVLSNSLGIVYCYSVNKKMIYEISWWNLEMKRRIWCQVYPSLFLYWFAPGLWSKEASGISRKKSKKLFFVWVCCCIWWCVWFFFWSKELWSKELYAVMRRLSLAKKMRLKMQISFWTKN